LPEKENNDKYKLKQVVVLFFQVCIMPPCEKSFIKIMNFYSQTVKLIK